MGLNWTPTLKVNFSQFLRDTFSHEFLSRARKQFVRPANVHWKNTAMSLITTWMNVAKAIPIKKYLVSKITQVRVKVMLELFKPLSKNYNPHLHTSVVSFTAYCPDGYYYEKGELHGASIEGGVLLSLEDCGSRCRNNRKCQSFEHNSFNNHCFLNNASHPNSPRNTESLFCSKKGQLTKFRLSMISVNNTIIYVLYMSHEFPFCPQSIVNGRPTKEITGVRWIVVQGQ